MEYRADGFSDVMRLYRSQTAQTGEVWIPDYDLAEKYQYNGLFSKIIDRPAEEACKHGLDYNVSDSELAAYLDDALDRLDWEEKATAAIRWARLFGGAIIVMLLDDGRGLEEPVNWQDIRSVEELRVYERAVVQPDPEVYRSGTAEYFDISSTYGGTFRVHRSRCLIFKNGTLPEYGTAQQYYYWGLPEYIRIKRDLSIALRTHTNAANMIEKSVQPVYKQRGLQSMLAGPNGDDMELKRLQVLDASRGMMNTIAIDMEGEEYDFKTFQMSGTKEILDSACNLLSAVTCIPQTILFGRSPAGENATGESDLENYYNFVEGIQKRMLKKNVRTLIKAIVQAGIYDGSIAENPGIIKPSFPPLWSLTETERAQVDLVRAQTEQANAQTVQMYMDMQIIGPEEVRQALAKNGKLIAEQIPEQEESADWEELLNSLENENHLQNSNGQDTVKSAIIKGQNADDRLDEFKESDHPRDKDGRFSESGSGGQSKAESQKKESAREPQEAKVSATGSNKFKKGFSKNNLDKHFGKGGKSDHSVQYPDMTKAQYAKRALQLVQSATSDTILGYKTPENEVVRYDKITNDFTKGHPEKGIKTMFKPDDGEEYFKRALKREHGTIED